MKIDPNSPANPTITYSDTSGISIRVQIALSISSDFDTLPTEMKHSIAGPPPMRTKEDWIIGDHKVYREEEDIGSSEYIRWMASGRAKWRIIQADALIDELNTKS